MVSEKSDGVFSPLEVMSPVIKSMDDGEQLTIIDVIVPFCRGKSLRKVCARVKVAILILLHEDPSTGKEGHISHDYEGSLNVRKTMYGGSLEFSQKGVEGSLMFRVPGPRLVLSCQVSEGGNDIRESQDKFAIDITKTKE